MAIEFPSFYGLLSGGDPGINQRFLLKTAYPLIVTVVSYVLFVLYVGPAVMKNRNPVKMRPLMVAYNLSLAAAYTYLCIAGLAQVLKTGPSIICTYLRSDNPDTARYLDLAYYVYVVRYIELFDTVFLVLSKKSKLITTLHVFHHAIVPVFAWFVFRSETNAYLIVCIGINAVVHIIMYTYYAIAAMGPEYQKYLWWKKYLTSFQILQFRVNMIYLLIMSLVGCAPSKGSLMFCLFLCTAFLYLFTKYYSKTFVKKEGINGVHKSNESAPVQNGSSANGEHAKLDGNSAKRQ